MKITSTDSDITTGTILAAPTLAVPRLLESALAEDTVARTSFDSLSVSCRKQYISWIASAKKQETGQRRVEEALKMLREKQRLR